MVKFALPLIALAMAGSVAAAPAPATAETSATTFSFEQWVEDLIANPDTALSVDEAIAAAEAADVVGSAGGLRKRVSCDQGWARAPGRDAVSCVNSLAALGRAGVTCSMGATEYNKVFCETGNAKISAGKSYHQEVQSANCNDVARTAGIIFDNCWRSDDTISGSEICVTNNRMQINISAR